MFNLPAVILIYVLCLPLAIFSGYLLATPDSFMSVGTIGMVGALLTFPLLLKWHHALLILSWNSFLIVFMLPGQPGLGICLGIVSLGVTVLNRTMGKSKGVFWMTPTVLPLLFLTAVIAFTILASGKFGSRALGSEYYGGKRYITLVGAIIGFFAIAAQAIPERYANRMAQLFFVSGMTAVISDLIYAMGPSFYFLFVLFNSGVASLQAQSQETVLRLSGISSASLALCYFLLCRYGIEGLFRLTCPWRFLGFAGAIAASLFGGFRSSLIILALMMVSQFYFEGLFRTRFLPLFVGGIILIFAFLIPSVDRLPLAVQRSLSFLPINVDHRARSDALGTLDWRLQMWKTVLPDVPKYLLIGKGFGYDGTDYMLTQEAVHRGLYTAYEDTLVSGNYHNGWLTILIPFGLWGLIGFAWFCWAGGKVLYANYRFGDPSLKNTNTFLLAYFVARLMFYLGFYGQFDLDFVVFTGTVALSLSLNRGVRQPSTEMSWEDRRVAVPAPAYA